MCPILAAGTRERAKPSRWDLARMFGGERGIRTLDTGLSPYNALAGRPLRPLGHLSGEAKLYLSGTLSLPLVLGLFRAHLGRDVGAVRHVEQVRDLADHVHLVGRERGVRVGDTPEELDDRLAVLHRVRRADE